MGTISDPVWNSATWMADSSPSVQTRPLCNLVMPGTHDSGSYGISEDSRIADQRDVDLPPVLRNLYNDYPPLRSPIFQILKAWAKTTDCTFRQQLDAGIRYLDLRVIKREGSYYFCHMLEGTNVEDGINDVVEFIAANPKEIVILDFNHLYEMSETDRGLVDQLIDAFGAKIAPASMNAHNSLADFWKDGYQVIIFWQFEKANAPFWNHIYEDWQNNNDWGSLNPENQIHSRWIRKQTPAELECELFRDLTARLSHKELSDKLYISQGLISPDSNLMLGAVYSGLEDAKRLMPGLIPFEALEVAQELVKKQITDPYIISMLPHIPVSIRLLAKQVQPTIRALIDNRNVFQNIVLVDWFNDIHEFAKQLNAINLEYPARHGKDD